MSEQLLPPPQPPCQCQAEVEKWKEKYSKLEVKRGHLRQAVKVLEQEFDKIQTENLNLKKGYEEDRARAEKEGKERELAIRVPLENEISSLKSEISSLQQEIASGRGHENEKVTVLEAKLAAGDKEINRLKELLKKEKARAGSEKNNAESEKKRANEAWKTVAAEKSKADEERKVLEQKIEEYKLSVEALKKEADQVRRKLGLETSMYAEANKKLELEKQQLKKERQRANAEKARAEEQRKLVEVNVAKLMEEKCRADNLSRKIEESNTMIEKLQRKARDLSTKISDGHVDDVNKISGSEMAKKENNYCLEMQKTEASKQKLLSEEKRADSEKRKAEERRDLVKKYKRRALEEKCRADQLSARLNVERQRNQEVQQKQLGHSLTKPVEVPMFRPAAETVDESAKLKLLKKQLKLQKMKAKHAKEVAELEKFRQRIILQEVQRLKLDFGQIFRRLDMLDNCLVSSYGGIDEREKNEYTEMQSWKKRFYGLQPFSNNELMKPFKASFEDPTCGGSSTDFISGIDSKSGLPPGGSRRKKLKHSGINSALASFSDRGLVGSQDKGDITVSESARLLEDHLNQLTNASSPLDGINRISSNENTAMVAENSVRCPLVIDGDEVNKHGLKRKRLIDVVESVESMCLKSRKLHLDIEKKLTIFHDMLMGQLEGPVDDRRYLADNDPLSQQRFQNKTLSYEEKLQGENLCLDYQGRSKEHLESEARLVETFCRQASDEAHMSILEEREDLLDPFLNDIMGSSKLVDGDYMKLLELDNCTDEEWYQAAIERPLSPTLPEIDMEGIKALNLKTNGDTHQGVPCRVESLAPSVEHGVNNIKVDSSKLSFTLSETKGEKLLHKKQGGVIPNFLVGWSLRNILIELKMEEKLLSKEKAYAFFSMLLLQFSAIRTFGPALNRDAVSCIDSFDEHIRNVISDAETRIMLEELCSIDEFLSLIEDFLVEGKLILCSEMSSEELITCERRISLVLEGVNVLVSSGTASAELLVAGSVMLAALCAAVDKIDFICEASHRIFWIRGADSSVVLTILHVFAHISGGNYFTLRSQSLLMTVLSSLVVFLEGAGNAAGSVCVLSQGEIQCVKCPFSDKAVPPDVILSLLLEELQSVGICGEGHNKVIELISATQDEVLVRDNIGLKVYEDVQSRPDGNPDSSCLKICGTTDTKLHNQTDLYNDLFLLVELIALNLGWEWTKTKILPQLLKILESGVQERSAAAVVILVGRLGRFGVDSSGCNDTSIESLRCHLYSLLCQACTSKFGFPIQCSIVMALLSLLPLDFENILDNGATLPDTASVSVPARAIGKWFSSLSKEEQASMYILLRLATANKKLRFS
ncbi:hypothetical protein CDL15_Pgr006035 [Punica granatum]|uniref:Uncharacterized protein n=1 Tax=Punica granatum TaxID=22663 RepID=A0A218VTV6_PUNGR|nr:hypothetical protein CDL15_Pgr006035 [Punica granatum]